MVIRKRGFVSFLFIEKTEGYSGKRLFLKKIDEKKNAPEIETLSQRCCEGCDSPENKDRFLVTFQIEKVLPLVGDKA